jgi:hypothetical protein
MLMPRGDGSSDSKVSGPISGVGLFVLLFCLAFWLGVLLLVEYLK